MRFLKKRVAVTGAASGIGAAIAEGFATEGASVAFLDLNDSAYLTGQSINVSGGTVM